MSNSIHLYFADILDSKRLELLPSLYSFTQQGYLLWWGTALALVYGHRESIDFDFFINQDIDTKKLFQDCITIFNTHQIVKIFEATNTLYITVDGVKISFFSYHYEHIDKIITSEYLNIYSIKDIAAMKLRAIQNRATTKDYVDLYYMIKDIWLSRVLESFMDKFWPVVTESYLLKSLIYFDDILDEQIVLKDKKLNFEKVKQEIKNEVLAYSQS